MNGKTIGIENVHSLKKLSAEIEQQKEMMAADLKKFKEPKEIFDKVDENAEKKTVGIRKKKEVVVLPKKDYERLGVLAKSSIRSNYQFENYKSDTKKEIGK
ncbi:hypothetical protein, partial [Sporosarcina sp. FSL K6-5500]|uniref:hypothetical protein n=1 Tax=Sporosarcina sp. FSL K6-5500 TaxID=2921558 RepID=UPI004046A6D5